MAFVVYEFVVRLLLAMVELLLLELSPPLVEVEVV